MHTRALLLALLASSLLASLVAPATALAGHDPNGPSVCLDRVANARASVFAPTITVSPAAARPGDTVTVTITGFLPNQPTELTLRIGGDPIVGSGTTDANGTIVFTFVVPYYPSGTYALRAPNANLCGIIGELTILPGLPPTATATRPPATATPTATPTTPPAQTATATPTPTMAVATATTPPPTPRVPVTGSGSDGSGPLSGSGNLAMIALGLVLVASAFTALRLNQWLATARPDDWSTDPTAGDDRRP